jgi:serine protease AprX
MLPSSSVPAFAAALLLLAPASSVFAQDLDPSGEAPRELRGRSVRTVALPGGAIIHTTSRALAGVRSIELPAGGVLMLWEELEAGRGIPFYAYSMDGRTLAGRVRENDLLINLRYGGHGFDPVRHGGAPMVDRSLRAPDESHIHIVQFHAAPLPEMQFMVEAIAGPGAILRHIPDSAVIVRMDAAAKAEISRLPFVRWTGPFHTAYKLDEAVLAEVGLVATDHPAALDQLRYSVEVFDRGMDPQQRVGDAVRAAGGLVEVVTPDGYRMEITVTARQLLEIARIDDVHFIDPWGGPGGTDMDIVRAIGGANFIESTLNFTGQGVRGEVFDTELRVTHQEFSTFTPIIHSATAANPLDPHGTSVFGHVFARGAVATARGLLPGAEARIFYKYTESTQFGGNRTRLSLNQELVNPAGIYRAVFQTSSVGSDRTTVYTTISTEVDDYLYQTRLLSLQSQSNAGATAQPRDSRPQAWAKNIVSGGAVNHLNTLTRTDDRWLNPGGASIGPAADGRIKPDLAFFYDSTHGPDNASDTAYTQFGGTSGATPSIAGYFGLFYQMWHQGVWAGRGGASSVFASRANMMTAKAALISTAYRYDWNSGGFNASINRNVQGWGMPDIQALYNIRNKTVIVDEEDVLTPLGVNTYNIRVDAGEPTLNIVMSYIDRAGTTSATIHRINDLSLKVTSPGGVVYWGNNGLAAGNFSATAGSSNTRDTVECVFVENPQAGLWTVQVLGDSIVQDAHPATPAIDAVYGLWITGATRAIANTTQGPVMANPSKAYTPIDFAASNGGGTINTLTRDLARTYQMVISASELDYLKPGSKITGMSFRAGGIQATWPTADANWVQYDVQLASALTTPGAMSTTFASNVGSDAVIVRSGALTIPAGSIRNDGILPRAFGPTITFTSPYQYKGGDLVVTVRHTGNAAGGAGAGAAFLDGVNSGSTVAAAYADSATATVAGFPNTTATIIRFATDHGQVAPHALGNTAGGGTLNSPIQTTGRTVQLIIDEQHLSHIPRHSAIDSIGFRVSSGGLTWPAGGNAEFGDYQVEIGRSSVPAASMSSTVAANHSADVIVGRSGPLTIREGASPGGAGPNPFGVVIPLTRPYVYTGGNLVLTLRHTGSSRTPQFLDLVPASPATPGMAMRYETSATATTATLTAPPLVTLIGHIPSVVSPNAFAMAMPPTTGGNSGPISNTGATVQMMFAANQLSHIPVDSLINGMSWRVSSTVSGQTTWPTADAVFNQYDVQLSQPATTPATMSTTFDANLGTNVVTVRSGALTIPAGSFPGGAAASELNPFGFFITFDRPYRYQGGNLLLTVRQSGAGAAGLRFLDGLAVGGAGYGVVGAGVVVTGNPAATSGFQTTHITTRFSYTPEEAGACYANCDGSSVQPVLNVDDFTCFINQYANAQGLPHAQQLTHYANCDGSTTAPALNVDDFTCFINRYAMGCP